ncbi:hypothetical protein [Primorskyibacter sp. S187A]|uniref:hypothetical protein n=1 Tax=Primorskyibacter sp. S187A TaxID=3415130 RepID=UPI003C7E3164
MRKFILLNLSLFTLAACGYTVGEQTLAGGTVGAASALVLEGDPVKGAIIGAAGNLILCQSRPSQCN